MSFTLPGSNYKYYYKSEYYLAVAQSALFGKVGEVKDAVEELEGKWSSIDGEGKQK